MSTVSDPIADMLTRLRNSRASRKAVVNIPHSKIKEEIARILKQEGYISDYEVAKVEGHNQIQITTRYVNKASAITGLKRISKPGLRKYVGADELPRVLRGLGIAIVSTSQGIFTDREARKKNIGGELLAYVW